jgi:hypothetical protein
LVWGDGMAYNLSEGLLLWRSNCFCFNWSRFFNDALTLTLTLTFTLFLFLFLSLSPSVTLKILLLSTFLSLPLSVSLFATPSLYLSLPFCWAGISLVRRVVHLVSWDFYCGGPTAAAGSGVNGRPGFHLFLSLSQSVVWHLIFHHTTAGSVPADALWERKRTMGLHFSWCDLWTFPTSPQHRQHTLLLLNIGSFNSWYE